MDARVFNARRDDPADASIGELFYQLVADGKAFAGAEANLYKRIALYRANKAKVGAGALVAGGALAFAGLIAALVGVVLGLAPLIGPVGGGLVVLAVTGLIAFLLVRFGASKMKALSGDPDETAALATAERKS